MGGSVPWWESEEDTIFPEQQRITCLDKVDWGVEGALFVINVKVRSYCFFLNITTLQTSRSATERPLPSLNLFPHL